MRDIFFKISVGFSLILSALLASSTVMAQENEYIPLLNPLDFLAVKDIQLTTSAIFDYGQIQYWTGEGLHTGLQSFRLTIFNHTEIDKNAPIPENTSFNCEIFDLGGTRVAGNEIDLENTFNRIKFSNKFYSEQNLGMTVIRGGQYKLVAEISPQLFSYEKEFTLVDEPGMQIISDRTGTIDSIPVPQIFLSSGYPYEPLDFSGEKYLNWKMTPVNSSNTEIIEGTEIFELKSETPTLAAFAMLSLKPEITEPGEYQFTLTSDFAPANYSFVIKIDDVLDPEITFDKSIYTVGESNEATINVDMSYGYPYVGVGSSSEKPTVTVNADLLGDETSVSYSNEAWGDSDMHCAAEIKVPLDKVTAEMVKENGGEMPLHLSILFNGEIRFETTLSLPFESGSSGIRDIDAYNSGKSRVRYFNIYGVEVDESYRGLVITSDGRKLIW